MHYETDKNNHGLPRNPFKSCVVPRPIGWMSTLSRHGKANLAPFSQFNILGWDPPYIMFAASAHPVGAGRKHTVRNVQETGEFVFNMATYDLRDVPFGPFLTVRVDNEVTLDFADADGKITPQHYAFLIGEAEFDEVFGRIRERKLRYWADPYRHRPGEINTGDGGRRIYFDDPSGHYLEVLTRPYGSGS